MPRRLTRALLYGFVCFLGFSRPSAASSGRGPVIFEKLCAQCHGPQGEGNSRIEAPAIAGAATWHLEAQLRKFRDGVRGAHPKDVAGMRMRPMANTLRRDSDLIEVAAFVASLPAPMAKASLTGGNAQRGQARFGACAACHGPEGKGNEQLSAPRLAGQNDWYLRTQLKNFKAGVRGGDAARDPIAAPMRAMAASLDNEAVLDVLAYLNTLSGK